jgi:hypothetical protein
LFGWLVSCLVVCSVDWFCLSVTHEYQTPDFSVFEHRRVLAPLQRAVRPSDLDWSYIIGLSCSEVSSFLGWAASGFPGSPSCRWPLWDYPASDCVSKSNKTPPIIIYSIGSISLETSD